MPVELEVRAYDSTKMTCKLIKINEIINFLYIMNAHKLHWTFFIAGTKRTIVALKNKVFDAILRRN